MVQAAGAMTLLALGVYTAKNTTHLAARRLEAILGRPSLVRETSRVSPLEFAQHPIRSVQKLFRKTEEPLKGVVLHAKLEERLRDIAIATKNTRSNRGCYRNVMFYGPPGTYTIHDNPSLTYLLSHRLLHQILKNVMIVYVVLGTGKTMFAKVSN